MSRAAKHLAVALLAMLIVGGPAAAQDRTDPLIASTEDPLELQQLAVQFIAGNRPREAMAALSKALRIAPGNAEAHMWLAVVFAQLEDDAGAQAEFERALEINPQLTEAHNWFGVYWARRGELDRAIGHYRAALADPAYPRISRARVLVNLGNTLMQKGDVEAALPVLSEAARTPVTSSDPLYALLHLSLAEGLLKAGRPQESLGALERMQVLPPSARAELLTGLAQRDLGEVDEAVDHLQRVLRLAPGSELAEQALDALRQLNRSSGG